MRDIIWSGAAAALGGFLHQHPLLLAYALLGVAACAAGVARGGRDTLGTGAAAVAFLVVIAPFAIIDRYLLPLLPLAVLSGVALAGPGDPERTLTASSGRPLPSGPRRWGLPAAGALVVLGWTLAPGFAYPESARSEALRTEYARVGALAAAGAEVLAEGGHIFRYYAQQSHPGGVERIRRVLVDYDGRRLLLRTGVHYDTVSAERRAWIVLQRRAGAEPEIFEVLAERCGREDSATHAHFGCGGVDGGP